MTPEFWLDPLSLKSPSREWSGVPSPNNDNSDVLCADKGKGTQPSAAVLVGGMVFGAKGSSRLRRRTWTLRAANYDDSIRMYVNGNLAATQSVKGTIFTTTDRFKIGGNWSGEIDDGRNKNTALPQTRLKTDKSTPARSSGSLTVTVNPAGSLTLIDSTHQRWAAAFILIAALTYGLYVALPAGRSASLWPGLLFGLGGTGLALFCGLLPGRKKLLRIPLCANWRILRSSIWEKGHIYFGLLSWLLLQCHARFRTGGLLTSVLLVVLWAIIGSGLAGLLFRHLLVLTKAGREGKGLRAASVIATGHFLAQRLHVPLTLTLFILGAAHAVMALFY
jgi:hypothetical protein